MDRSRRRFVQSVSASLLLAGSAGCVVTANRPKTLGRVVVIGAGYAGATATRYLHMWSPDIDVTLIDPNRQFVSCAMSNRVLSGAWDMSDITRSYAGLKQRGVRIIHQSAVDIDPVKQIVTLRDGQRLQYDRVIVAPGIELVYENIPGMRDPASLERIPHAWKAGPQTAILRQQLVHQTHTR